MILCMRRAFSVALSTVVCLTALIDLGCSRREAEPTPPEAVLPAPVQRAAPQFRPVAGAEGLQETVLFTQPLPDLRSHLEIRTILIPAGRPVTLESAYEGVLEVRAGSVTHVVGDQRRVRERGELWQVAKGSRVVLQAAGELAALRAIYLIPDRAAR